MSKMQWVNDSAVALHFNDNLVKDTIEIGYRTKDEAARSLLQAMRNDESLMGIVMSAACIYWSEMNNEEWNKAVVVIKALI